MKRGNEEAVGKGRRTLPTGRERTASAVPAQPVHVRTGAPRPRWLVTEHMAETDFERRITEEVEAMDRRERVGREYLRRVQEGAGPAL